MRGPITVISTAVLAACGAAILGMLVLLTFAFGAVPNAFPKMQLPLSSVDGMRVVNDRVYIAGSATGRVLEYDLEGHLVKWLQMPKRPISLTAQDDRLVVRYSGGERILETGLLEGLRPPSAVRLEHTWWGHPWLVIGEGQQQRSFSLQPWYLTLLQLPWPGGLYGPLFILALLWASIAWSKERGRDRAEPTPFRSR